MRMIRIAAKVILIMISVMLIAAGIFILCNGSLEMMPTPEQQEKSRIAAWILIAIGFIAALFGVKFKRKQQGYHGISPKDGL